MSAGSHSKEHQDRIGLAANDSAAADTTDGGTGDRPKATVAEQQASAVNDGSTPAQGAQRRYKAGVAIIWLSNAAHSYSISSVFSYAGFLAVDCGWAEDLDRAGLVAGLLAAMLPLGRVPTSSLWGIVADRIGNKKALTLSMTAVAAGNLLFGFSTSLWLALSCRFVLLGACNGWMTLFGPLCMDIGGASRQAHVFGAGIGGGTAVSILAPSLGAFTYGTLSHRFPALAPSLIGAVLGGLTALAAFAWLPEAHTAAEQPASEGASGARVSACRTISRGPLRLITGLRAVSGFILFALFDVLPLWAIGTPEAGGMGLSKEQLGGVLTATCTWLWAFSTFLQGRVMTRFGFRRGLFLGGSITACALVAMPLLGRASVFSMVPLLCLVYNGMVLSQGAVVGAFNVESAKHASVKGALNGISVTFEALAKGLGPTVGAPLIAVALYHRQTVAFFMAMAALTGGTHALGMVLLPREEGVPTGPRPAPAPVVRTLPVARLAAADSAAAVQVTATAVGRLAEARAEMGEATSSTRNGGADPASELSRV